jgi:hypothetical protein
MWATPVLSTCRVRSAEKAVFVVRKSLTPESEVQHSGREAQFPQVPVATVIDVVNSKELWRALSAPRSFVPVGLQHLISKRIIARFVASNLSSAVVHVLTTAAGSFRD